MSKSYTLIALQPSKLTHYSGDYDFDREDLLVERGLTLSEMEDRVAELALEIPRSRQEPYGSFMAFEETNEEAEYAIERVLRSRVDPVLAQRKLEKEAKEKEEAKARKEDQRRKDLAELARLTERLAKSE